MSTFDQEGLRSIKALSSHSWIDTDREITILGGSNFGSWSLKFYLPNDPKTAKYQEQAHLAPYQTPLIDLLAY